MDDSVLRQTGMGHPDEPATGAFTRSWIRREAACARLPIMGCQRSATASCGAAGLRVHDSTGNPAGSPGVRDEFEFVEQDDPGIGPRSARAGQIRGHHDEVRTIERPELTAVRDDPPRRFEASLAEPRSVTGLPPSG